MRLLLTALLVVPGVAGAGQFYKCETADGSTRYQDTPCAATENESQPDIVENAIDSSGDRQRVREQRAKDRLDAARDIRRDVEMPEPAPRTYFSFRCSAKGVTWYRHDDCPLSITVADKQSVPISGSDYVPSVDGWVDIDATAQIEQSREIPVKKVQVSRSLACGEIRNPGSREGAERDSEYSTYQRNKGRDPCSPKYLE